MEIGILSDTHANTGWTVRKLDDFADANITTIIQLGDFGFWPGTEGDHFLQAVQDTLTENGQALYITPGNHEDYVRLTGLVTVQAGDDAGWQYLPEYTRILVAPRGHRWVWNDVSFLSVGGANSIDRYSRTPYVSWWPEEQISTGDVYRAIEGGTVDIMITHDCPAGVELFGGHKGDTEKGWPIEGLEYAAGSREQLRTIVDEVKPTMLFHGHFHFYYDTVTELNDLTGNTYRIRTVGLAADEMPKSAIVITLNDWENDNNINKQTKTRYRFI